MQRQDEQVPRQQQPFSSSLPSKSISEMHDSGQLSDFNPLQPQQQPSFQPNRPTLTPVPYDSGNIESPALAPTDVTLTPSAIPGRRPSLVEGILTTAATAASTAVEAARSLVSHEDILEEEAKEPIKDLSSSTTSKSLFPLLGSESHHGLEFKQRKLSVDKAKKDVPATKTIITTHNESPTIEKTPITLNSPPLRAHTHSDVASRAADAVTQWLEDTKAEKEIERQRMAALTAKTQPENVDSKDNLAPDWPVSDVGASFSSNGTGSILADPSQGVRSSANANSDVENIKAGTNANIGGLGGAGVGVDRSSSSVSDPNDSNISANAGQLSRDPPRTGNPTNPVRSNSQSSGIRHNTIYVTGHGPESVRHGSMGVDKPAISSSYHHHHRNSSSGMGVDQPLLVGQPRDPKEHRKGGLQVDTKHPDDTYHHEVHQPHDHKEEGAEAAAAAATGVVPVGGRGSVPGRGSISGKGRRSSMSGLNVDQPPAPSKQLAGHGSNEITHRSGSYNSGINVDKAGSKDNKRSGMGVDEPALSNYRMASMHDRHLHVSGRGNNTDNVGTEHKESLMQALYTSPEDASFVEARGSGFDEGGSIQVNRYSTSSRALLTAKALTTTNQNLEVGTSSHTSQTIDNTAGHIVTEVPADYHGPLPQVAPGEHVVWVKKVIKTDYYEGGEQGSQSSQPKRSSISNFLDRFRGRKSTRSSSNHNTIDKGKQRQ